MERAGAIRLKPQRPVLPGNGILLHAKYWKIKAVDDILRRERQFDRSIDRHVQFINLTPAFGMLHLPHPLFADDIDILGAVGRRFSVHVYLGAPDKHDERDHERYS